ncbi:hypothetical protein C8J57DRAFT_1194082 [Mycena rebaudengoi]|nr:hypothetical protein C8J57DRAFT_1194082 [Mycena rebaudengoi]
MLTAVLGAVEVMKPRPFPHPYHTLIRTGHIWIQELLGGHPDRMRHNMGMHKHVFPKLVLWGSHMRCVRPRGYDGPDATPLHSIYPSHVQQTHQAAATRISSHQVLRPVSPLAHGNYLAITRLTTARYHMLRNIGPDTSHAFHPNSAANRRA